MMGSFLTRGLVMALGYAYPAYECFKTVEKNKPEVEQLRFWCQYWILVAVLTVFERIGDTFISWLPMYSEAKLAFFVYLWYPKTKGTVYVYDAFFRPYVAKHETEIDRNLMELKARAGDFVVLYWQKASSYGQTRIFEILQYFASQSQKPQPSQKRQQSGNMQSSSASSAQHPPAASAGPTSALPTPQTVMTKPQQAPSQPRSTHSANQKKVSGQGSVNSVATVVPDEPVLASVPSPVTSNASANHSAVPGEEQEMQIDSPRTVNGGANPPPKEELIDDAIRVTRARLRTRVAARR